LVLSFLLINGVPAATLLAFRFRKQLLLYNSGVKKQSSEELSPGWLLLSYHIENAIASQTSRYDFMQGDEAYKYRLGGQTDTVYQVRLIK
jgi:CelD/BcsL family acetyltransferase involved in cellulose biosynthesis